MPSGGWSANDDDLLRPKPATRAGRKRAVNDERVGKYTDSANGSPKSDAS
jgi:hypothetical protein